ncbi:MAG: NEAT domain-containing protein [Terrisporobacter sp.]|uniref:NEAT domain-containing protein n=1 Tax=Terrisporobacter sp. TaxID=1965305 RepID=UPI002FCAAC76
MKKIKNILFMAIFSLIMSVQTISASAGELSELASGIYDIKNEVYHEQELGMEMARTYLNENMILEKLEGKWYYTVTFSGTNYMENYRILIGDKEVKADVLEENEEDHIIKLKFQTPKINPDLSTKIYVDAMERDVEFDIIPKEETLNLVKAIEEPTKEVKLESMSKDTEAKDETYNNTSNKTIFIGVGVTILLICTMLALKKLKK